jgi:hypothetical protein
MEEIFNNTKKLREAWTFDGYKKQTFAWEKQAREHIAIEGVAKTDAIKMLLKEIDDEIKDTIDKLAWSKGITEIERARLETKRDDYLWFCSFFVSAGEKLKVLENKVLAEIKNLEKQ